MTTYTYRKIEAGKRNTFFEILADGEKIYQRFETETKAKEAVDHYNKTQPQRSVAYGN